MASSARPGYPVQVEADYPERQSRWKALLRLPLSIPVLIFSSLLGGGAVLAIWAAILVSGRIPRWLFDFKVAANRWQVRAGAFFLLLTDQYPPFEGDYLVWYDLPYPEKLSRWRLVIWKFITSIPHLMVLFLLGLSLVLATVIAWLAIIASGRYPKALHAYVVAVLRWFARVQAYVLSLTDEFPPFSFAADARTPTQRSYVISAVGGVAAAAGLIAGFVVFVQTAGQDVTRDVAYEGLLAGQVPAGDARAHVISATVELTGASDSADRRYPFLLAKAGYRLVQFGLRIEITRPGDDVDIRKDQFSVKDTGGDTYHPLLAVVGGRIPPITLNKHDVADIVLVFELPAHLAPAELRYDVVNYIEGPRVGETIIYEFH